MKLNKDPFLVNMNMVKLEGKKVLVRPSQAKMAEGKEVVIGEEQSLRMIKTKSPKDGQCQKNQGASHNVTQRPPLTSSWPSTRKAGPASGGAKIGQSRIPNRIVQFP
jgi:hypothetical protein